MKKIFTLSLLTAATLGFSQTFKLTLHGKDISGTTITENIKPNITNVVDLGITNTKNANKKYRVSRKLLSPAAIVTDYEIYFCTGSVCYLPNDTVEFVSDTIDIKANAVFPIPGDPNSYGIAAHFNTSPAACQDHTVLYKIWDVTTPTDKAEVTIKYSCANSIDEFDAGTVSAAYPNPANHTVAIDYTLTSSPKNAKVVFYDMLGKTVKVAPVANKEGTVKVNVADLHAGFYFYTFIVDGKSTNARKLVISAN